MKNIKLFLFCLIYINLSASEYIPKNHKFNHDFLLPISINYYNIKSKINFIR